MDNNTPMLVLGIETTCDETAAAVVERQDDGSGRILSNIVQSQIDEHAPFGGVVPEIAARAHVELLDGIIAQAMMEAERRLCATVDGIAAAAGPGLIGGVIVGLTTAKAIALVHETPLIAVNHLEAHALTPRLTDALDVSLLPVPRLRRPHPDRRGARRRRLCAARHHGRRRDRRGLRQGREDARRCPIPAGRRSSDSRANGDPERFAFPRPMLGRPDAEFLAVRIEDRGAQRGQPADAAANRQDVSDLCAGFQAAVLESIADRLRVGLRLFRERFGTPHALVAAGGVAANQAIRNALQDVAVEGRHRR